MSAPPLDPWTVALHASAGDDRPLGAGVVIDHSLVLTCAHVVRSGERLRPELWVAFPKAPGVGWRERRRVGKIVVDGWPQVHVDAALLELVEPVPAQVTPARLRCLAAGDLTGRPWWAFGFPAAAGQGCPAHGTVGEPLSYGCVHLDRSSDYGLAAGFSGSPLWSPDYQAVVGLVVSAAQGVAQEGDGQALTLAHADQQLPEMKLAALAGWQAQDAEDTALAAWGWMLGTDEEAGRHWLPRARGVGTHSEEGSRFTGRGAALRALVSWLDRPAAAGRPLVVTGSPGVGKSAVLGRVVTTADRAIQEALPPEDDAVRATVDSVHCAVHAKGKNALEVAAEIARAASLRLPAAPVDLAPALRDRLAHRPARFNLVVDALDECASPAAARTIIKELVLPLARGCAAAGVQVVVGTRRADDRGDLLAEFGPDAQLIDLDAPAYFSEDDLADYALATLRLAGGQRPEHPYAERELAAPVARRIAALACGNFLVAGLVARSRGLHDREPADPDRVTFTATVVDALKTYVAGLPPAGATPAWLALTALAFAETPGLTLPLWRAAVLALGGRADEPELAAFARGSAANFLVEAGTAAAPSYRLFHQALNEALRQVRAGSADPVADERALVYAWVRYAHAVGWPAAPEYLLRCLPRHAARTGLIDTLLNDDEYLLYAQLPWLLPAAESADTATGRARAQLLQRTPLAGAAGPAERCALFSVVDSLDSLGCGLPTDTAAPYAASWARTPPRLERTVLEGHSDAVFDVCAVPLDGRFLLASGGEDGTVRLWDPLTSQTERVLDCHDDCVRGLCVVHTGTGTGVLLATASHDGTVRLWDPRTGRALHTLRGHTDWVRNICAVPVGAGRDLLASASDDRTVRLWDPAAGAEVHRLTGHHGWVTAVCHVPAGDQHPPGPGLEASWRAGSGAVESWRAGSGAVESWRAGSGAVESWRAGSGAVESWWAGSGAVVSWWAGSGSGAADPGWTDAELVEVGPAGGAGNPAAAGGPLASACPGGLLASAGFDGTVRLWDPHTGHPRAVLTGHRGWVTTLCPVRTPRGVLLASAGYDGTVRLWDPYLAVRPDPAGPPAHPATPPAGAATAVSGLPSAAAPAVSDSLAGADSPAGAATSVPAGSSPPIGAATAAPAGSSPPSAALVATLDPAAGPLTDLCTVEVDGAVLIVSTGEDGVIRLWDAETRAARPALAGFVSWIRANCELPVGGRNLLATAGDDGTVRLWDVTTGRPETVMTGGRLGAVTGLCAAPVAGSVLAAVTCADGVVRCLDPGTGEQLREIRAVDTSATGACAVSDGEVHLLAIAGENGTVQIADLDEDDAVAAGSDKHHDRVNAVCALGTGRGRLVASAADDETIRLWDPYRRRPRKVLLGHPSWVTALATVELSGLELLASGDKDGSVRLWDPDGSWLWQVPGHHDAVNALCGVRVGDRDLLASAGADGAIRLWNPRTGAPVAGLTGHRGPATGVCPVPYGDREILASTGRDRSVRLWDPGTGRALRVIAVHHPALSCGWVDGTLLVGLDRGLLALRLRPPA